MKRTNMNQKMSRLIQTQLRPHLPVLRFSPTTWAKLLYLRDLGETEIGGFGISSSSDLFHVADLRLVHQNCTATSVSFSDEGVADYFDEQVDAGLGPQLFSRIWIHTHPGDCPQPSRTDEETFSRVFGHAHWSLMFILARGGNTYARLRFNVGAEAEVKIPVEVDFTRAFAGSDFDGWMQEYTRCVQPVTEDSFDAQLEDGLWGGEWPKFRNYRSPSSRGDPLELS